MTGRPRQTLDHTETLAALRSVPEVHDAVVDERPGPDGTTVVLGYVTGPDPDAGTSAIRQHLLSQLPGSLMPEHIVVLDELPLTLDGEYDLNALPDPPEEESTVDGHVEPRTPVETRIADMMRELVDVDRIGAHDSFFAIGGSSVQATRLAGRLRETFDVNLSLPDVFATPTVGGLAELVDAALVERVDTEPNGRRKRRRSGDLALAWRRIHVRLPYPLRRLIPPGAAPRTKTTPSPGGQA